MTDDNCGSSCDDDGGGEENKGREKEREEEKKNRLDELWAGFKNDLGTETKTTPTCTIATSSNETKVHEIYSEV